MKGLLACSFFLRKPEGLEQGGFRFKKSGKGLRWLTTTLGE